MNRRDALKQTAGWAGAALVAPMASSWACRIAEAPSGKAGKPPKKGDTVVIVVSVRHTHRRCTLPMDKTKFVPTGMKILGAMPWQKTGTGAYERKLKVVFLQEGKAKLRVIRSCSRGGCSQDLEYTVES